MMFRSLRGRTAPLTKRPVAIAAAGIKQFPPSDEIQHQIPQMLDQIQELLNKDRLDAKLLGMESLYRFFLSNGISRTRSPSSDWMVCEMSRFMLSNFMWREETISAPAASKVGSSIMDVILSLVSTRKLHEEDDDEEEHGADQNPQNGEVSTSFDSFYTAKMHLMGVQVLCCLLELVADSQGEGQEEDSPSTTTIAPLNIRLCPCWVQETLLPTLIQGMHVMNHMTPVPTHGAYLVTKCLRIALQCCCQDPQEEGTKKNTARLLQSSQGTDGSVKDLIQLWHSLGVQHHALLEEECARTIEAMGQFCNDDDDVKVSHER